MMQKYLLVLAAVLIVPVAYGLNDDDYPTFAKCDPNIKSSLETLWKMTGTPKNNLKKIEESGNLIVIFTSYSHNNDVNKCTYIKVKDNKMNVVFIPKGGKSSANLTWVVEEGNDGIIRGHRIANETPDITWNWYTLYSDNGIHVNYICSYDEGSREPFLGNVMLAEGSAKKLFTDPLVKSYLGLLNVWGMDLCYNYGSECFTNES